MAGLLKILGLIALVLMLMALLRTYEMGKLYIEVERPLPDEEIAVSVDSKSAEFLLIPFRAKTNGHIAVAVYQDDRWVGGGPPTDGVIRIVDSQTIRMLQQSGFVPLKIVTRAALSPDSFQLPTVADLATDLIEKQVEIPILLVGQAPRVLNFSFPEFKLGGLGEIDLLVSSPSRTLCVAYTTVSDSSFRPIGDGVGGLRFTRSIETIYIRPNVTVGPGDRIHLVVQLSNPVGETLIELFLVARVGAKGDLRFAQIPNPPQPSLIQSILGIAKGNLRLPPECERRMPASPFAQQWQAPLDIEWDVIGIVLTVIFFLAVPLVALFRSR